MLSDLSTNIYQSRRGHINNLVNVFYDIDNFYTVFIPQLELQCLTDGTRKSKSSGRMTMNEIMMIITFHMLNHRDFKNFYTGYLARFYKSDFSSLLVYTRFIEVMPSAVTPMC